MINHYFETEEFKNTLSRYEESKRDGVSCYLDSDDIFSLAEYYVYENNPELSAEVLELGLRLHGDNVHMWVFYASVNMIMHNYNEASELISGLDISEDYDVLYIKAQLKIAVDNTPQESDKLFREWMTVASSIDYNDEDKDDDEDAEEVIDEQISDEEHNVDVIREMYVQIITSYVDLSKTEAVRDEYARKWILEYIDKFSPLGYYQSDYDLANICNDMQYVDLIEATFKMLLDVDPYYPGGWGLLGAVQYFNGRIDDAVDSLEFALATEPESPSVLLTMAHCLYTKNNYKAALEYFHKYNAADPSDPDYLNMANCYYRLGDTDLAIEYLDKIVIDMTKQPINDDEFYHIFNIAETYYFCNFPQKSIQILEYLLQGSPENTDVLMFYGTCKLAVGDLETASVFFSQMLYLVDDYWQNLLSVATAFASYGPFEIAIDIVNSVLKYVSVHNHESDRLESAYAIMALAQFNSCNHQEFLKYLKLACNLTPQLVQQLFYLYLPESVNPIDYYDYMKVMTPKHG